MALGRLARRPQKYFTQGRIFVESGTYVNRGKFDQDPIVAREVILKAHEHRQKLLNKSLGTGENTGTPW